MGECVGLSWVDLQVIALTMAPDFGLCSDDAERVIRCMLDGGLIQRCEQHPDHFLAQRTLERLRRGGCDGEG